MKTLRITAALLLALVAAACTGSPTAPSVDAPDTIAHTAGVGMFGGGTRAP